MFYVFLGNNTSELPSVLIDKQVPEFSLPLLGNSNTVVTHDDLKGDYALINVWGTWCPNCRVEHPFFMQLAAQGVTIYGLNWRDPDQQEALKWLQKLGNPYKFSIADVENKLGLDLGVYGAPETFLINPQGVIIHKHVGVVSPQVWQNDFLPKIDNRDGEAGE